MQQENTNIIQFPKGEYGVKAIYSEQVISDYKGNPLIEALPPILSTDQAVEKLTNFPTYDSGEKELDAYYRYHCIPRLYQYFQPLNKHLDLENRISRTIRQGYLSRNPLSKERAVLIQKSYEAIKKGEVLTSLGENLEQSAQGFTILGLSGIGKSSGVKRVLNHYPQIIVHSNYKDTPLNTIQLSWLKLDCPFDGSIKGLPIQFFSVIDKLLGTKYFKKFGNRSNSTETMLQHMSHIASLHSIGVLIIDEIQHLNEAKSGGSDKMLNFFTTLVNTIGIPVILIGTNKAVSVLQSEFRQARRGSGQGDMVWDQWEKDEMWDLLIEGMWEYQWTKRYTPLTEELNNILYVESQGILDIAVKLFMISQLRAIATGKEEITPRLIVQVAKDSLRLVRPMLDALKSGIESEVMKYEDIRPIDMEEYFEKYKASIDLNEKIRIQKKVEELKRNKQQNSIIEEVVLKLLQMDIEPKLAKRCAEQVIKEHGEMIEVTFALKESMKLALSLEDEKKTKPKQRRTKKIESDKIIRPLDLRLIVQDGKKEKMSAYESLEKADFIRNPLIEII
ncbi:ATP-binding protein [Metabacillus sp. YM-086]|uniref:ATP-binding protein n=1 Tax=Metabacillus sp. YM-086 TaxID=3341729 RepID=UPI003A83FEAF